LKPGAYVHIPFCAQRCYYCAFTVAVSPESTYEPYVRRVLREIEMSGFDLEPETIYFGGGTPSLIPAESLAQILGAFRGTPVEVTVEANPATFSREKLERYRDMGITRISLGAQSLEDEDLQKAGRLHKARDVFEDFESLRRAGFTNVNLDLIAGLPGQHFDTWTRNLDSVVRLRPEHISIYMLDLEERSLWGKQTPEIPSDDEFTRYYGEAANRLRAAGYIHYEISNWALPGCECQHNLKYWSGAPYRGFGVGAHSYEPYRRFWNTASMTEYAGCIDAAKLPVQQEESLSREMRLEEAFLLGLRRMAGFDPVRAAAELNVQYPPEWEVRVQHLVDAGWIEFDGSLLKLKPAGWVLATSITGELLWPMPPSIFEATP
jgi:oxygen-independent coproporphyrinogen-3 oxidase